MRQFRELLIVSSLLSKGHHMNKLARASFFSRALRVRGSYSMARPSRRPTRLREPVSSTLALTSPTRSTYPTSAQRESRRRTIPRWLSSTVSQAGRFFSRELRPAPRQTGTSIS